MNKSESGFDIGDTVRLKRDVTRSYIDCVDDASEMPKEDLVFHLHEGAIGVVRSAEWWLIDGNRQAVCFYDERNWPELYFDFKDNDEAKPIGPGHYMLTSDLELVRSHEVDAYDLCGIKELFD